MDAGDWLLMNRTVRFGDTDAAGVMHFHQLLRWCHEAYEESLEHFGIAASEIFPTPLWKATPEKTQAASPVAVALPIIHCSADYFRPLVCGDPLLIQLRPRRLDAGSLEVGYRFFRDDGSSRQEELVARGLTRHRAITAASRTPCDLPQAIDRWLVASEDALQEGVYGGRDAQLGR